VSTTQAPKQVPRTYIDADQSEVATPRMRSVFRRLLFWIVALVGLGLVVVVIVALSGTSPSTARLDATNPKLTGAKALIQVLKTDGVKVDVPGSLKSAVAGLGDGTDPDATTLVIYDENDILNGSQLQQLAGATNVVLIEPSFGELGVLAPQVSAAGYAPAEAKAGCTFAPAKAAGTVSGFGKAYRVTPDAQGGSAAPLRCFGSHGAYSLVRYNTGSSVVTVVGSSTIFTNDAITRQGNAALALGLFGQSKHLVWYLPSFTDYTVQQDGVIPLPPWVALTAVLAAIVFLGAAFWRGRRLGPVVVERLPVFVRSSETVEGRARLYQKSSARTHAIDGLRMGTLSRLAKLCGLPGRASLTDVIGAVSRATGRTEPELRSLLVDRVPASDSDMMSISDALLALESETAERVRPA
jgi:hypothetical protein